MNKLFLIVLANLCLIGSIDLFADDNAKPSVPAIDQTGYKLAWADEFAGGRLDLKKWVYRTDSKRANTQKPEHVVIRDGLLHLELKKEEANRKPYSGAGVISKQTFKYGYDEAHMKIHTDAELDYVHFF